MFLVINLIAQKGLRCFIIMYQAKQIRNSVDKNIHIFTDTNTLYKKCIIMQQKKQGINLRLVMMCAILESELKRILNKYSNGQIYYSYSQKYLLNNSIVSLSCNLSLPYPGTAPDSTASSI